MIHYTCDLCTKKLPADERFVVKMEVYAAHDPAELTEADLEDDNLEAICEKIQELEDNDECAELTPMTKEFRYDLCRDCHQRFLRDPLGREQSKKVSFSKN
jgi:hypothetical protein